MIELFSWIGVIISFLFMIYHRYMHANYDQVYAYIRNKYGDTDGDEPLVIPSKASHARDARKYSLFTIFFASLLILLNFAR